MSQVPVRILALSGSLREDSLNTRLIRIASEMATDAGAHATLADLRQLDLPMYDGDLEARHGLPGGARRLRNLLLESDALLIASPEYNAGMSGALKNAIDWVSRPQPNERQPFLGLVGGLMAASPGRLGGLRGLTQLRATLNTLGVVVLPEQVAVPEADKALETEQGFASQHQGRALISLVSHVIEMASAVGLHARDAIRH